MGYEMVRRNEVRILVEGEDGKPVWLTDDRSVYRRAGRLHTTVRRHPDGRVEIVEVSICHLDDDDYHVIEADGSEVFRIEGGPVTRVET